MAANADVVITMVADAPDVEQVCLGENGLASGARPGLIVVDMSTIAPASARDIGARLGGGVDSDRASVSLRTLVSKSERDAALFSA